jgi:hypothetical protein
VAGQGSGRAASGGIWQSRAKDIRASTQGRNPVWGAIKGAVAAMSPAANAALIVALVIALLLLHFPL